MQHSSKDVSVIVPLTKSRIDFFEGFILPSIEANNPKEIIIVDDDAPATIKRNIGAEKATGKYLFFCDDDALLKRNCLKTLTSSLEREPGCAFAYCNFVMINFLNNLEPPMRNKFFNSIPWDPVVLREHNYIDTGSLIVRDEFMGFDESMSRFQDWEMWLRMAKSGKKGLFVPKLLFFSFKVTDSISTQVTKEVGLAQLEKVHPYNDWPFRDLPRNANV